MAFLKLILLYKFQIQSQILKTASELIYTWILARSLNHDLRTPIGVVMEFTELLYDNLESYNTETIYSAGHRLKQAQFLLIP
jgi:signal transduction histidine kinase